MSLLSKWSNWGHKVATQKTEPQNMSLLGKLSSLWVGRTQTGKPGNRLQNVFFWANGPVWGLRGHGMATQKTEPQNVSLLGTSNINGVARTSQRIIDHLKKNVACVYIGILEAWW